MKLQYYLNICSFIAAAIISTASSEPGLRFHRLPSEDLRRWHQSSGLFIFPSWIH